MPRFILEEYDNYGRYDNYSDICSDCGHTLLEAWYTQYCDYCEEEMNNERL